MFELPRQSVESGAIRAGVRKTLFGRFMLPDSSEHGCQVSDISIEGATFVAGVVPDKGQPLVAYLEQLGRVEAIAGDPIDGGFRVTFDQTGTRRERLATRVGWLEKERAVEQPEGRQFVRRELADGQSQITMPDGRTYPWGDDPPTCDRAVFGRRPGGPCASDGYESAPVDAEPSALSTTIESLPSAAIPVSTVNCPTFHTAMFSMATDKPDTGSVVVPDTMIALALPTEAIPTVRFPPLAIFNVSSVPAGLTVKLPNPVASTGAKLLKLIGKLSTNTVPLFPTFPETSSGT